MFTSLGKPGQSLSCRKDREDEALAYSVTQSG